MLRGFGYEIVLASPPDHDDLVAEIYFEGSFLAGVSQEGGPGMFVLELPGADVDEARLARKVDVYGFLEAVQRACDRLRVPKDI